MKKVLALAPALRMTRSIKEKSPNFFLLRLFFLFLLYLFSGKSSANYSFWFDFFWAQMSCGFAFADLKGLVLRYWHSGSCDTFDY